MRHFLNRGNDRGGEEDVPLAIQINSGRHVSVPRLGFKSMAPQEAMRWLSDEGFLHHLELPIPVPLTEAANG